MDTDKTDLRNRIDRLRQAFLRAESYSSDILINKYELPLSFLYSLCELGLLINQKNKFFSRSATWNKEPTMSLRKLTNIIIGKTKFQSDIPLSNPTQLSHEKVESQFIITSSEEDIIKPRRSLVMTFRLVKARRLQVELSWRSSQPFGDVRFNNPEVRHQHYEREAFEINGRVYRVIDLETDMLKTLENFFDGVIVETKVRHIHYK